jgi:hypothetical protein
MTLSNKRIEQWNYPQIIQCESITSPGHTHANNPNMSFEQAFLDPKWNKHPDS